jgi:chromosome segregation protein
VQRSEGEVEALKKELELANQRVTDAVSKAEETARDLSGTLAEELAAAKQRLSEALESAEQARKEAAEARSEADKATQEAEAAKQVRRSHDCHAMLAHVARRMHLRARCS